jgi:hypothetical protein
VILSGYWSQLYADELVGWNHATFKSKTRRNEIRTEWLWYNFPAPKKLHDDRYVGGDRRGRDYLKRKKTRWAIRLKNMQPLERQALLSAIASVAESEGAGLEA